MKKNIILFIVSFALLMEAVDTTIINTAIPVMSQSLRVDPIDLKLALISYLLSLAIFIPISGWIADKMGAKKVFITALGIFTLSSVWCGFSHSLMELILARFTQGLGGSLMLPIGRLIIIRTCERHELLAKMSIVIMVAALGMVLGPVLGGIITTHFSWRWIFWVNIPVGLLSILMSTRLLPAMPPLPVHVLDKFGFLLFGSGLATLTYGLSILSESDISHPHSLLITGVAIVLLTTYIWHSRDKIHPIVNVTLFRSRTFKVSVIGNLVARIGFGGIPFLLPLLLQIVLGYSAQLSGLLLAPTALGVLLVKPLSIYILRFFGFKRLLIINTILVGLCLWALAIINPAISIYVIACLTFIYGFLISLQYTAMNSLAYANVEHPDLSAATSIMGTIQQLAQSFGVAVAATMVKFFSVDFSTRPDLTVKIFQHTFIAMGTLTMLSVVIFFYLKKEDGHQLIALADTPPV